MHGDSEAKVERSAPEVHSRGRSYPEIDTEELSAVGGLDGRQIFFLLIGIKSRTDSSGLEQDLRNKVPGLRPYLQLLGMDLSYMFHFTYYDPSPVATYPLTDTDFFVEADIPQPDGSPHRSSHTSHHALRGTRQALVP